MAAGARDRSDRGQRAAWRADVVSRQRDRRVADDLVQRRRRIGRARSRLHPARQRPCRLTGAWISPAPRRPARHGRLRGRGGDRGCVRCAAGRRLLRLRTGDRRIYAGQPDAGRRRRRRRLFRHPRLFRAVARHRHRKVRRRARARSRHRSPARGFCRAVRHCDHARRGALRDVAGEDSNVAAAAPGARRPGRRPAGAGDAAA